VLERTVWKGLVCLMVFGGLLGVAGPWAAGTAVAPGRGGGRRSPGPAVLRRDPGGTVRRLAKWPASPTAAVALLLLLVPLLVSLPAAGEHPNHAQGFRPENTYELGDLENVNLFNGNLTLTISIGPSYPVGPGLSYGLVLTYSGNLWEWEEWPDQTEHRGYLQALVRERSNAGLGWEIGFGRLLGGEFASNHETSDVYLGPDQSQHSFDLYLHPGETSQLRTDVRYTQDSTYLRLRDPDVQNPGNPLEVDSPDGVTRTFRATDGRLTRMEDPFGNWVTVEYILYDADTNEYYRWEVTDSHGRKQILEFTKLLPVPHLGMAVSKVTLEGFGTGSMTYMFDYTTEPLARACNDPLVCSPGKLCGATDTGAVQVPLLRKVTLPDGSAFSMPEAGGGEPDAYHFGLDKTITVTTTCPDRPISGHLERLELPTGGRYEWTWQTYYFPKLSQRVSPRYKEFQENYVDSPFNRSVGLAERRHYDQGSVSGLGALGTWTYTQDVELSASRETEVWTQVARFPVGGVTRSYFSGYIDDGDTATTEPAGFFGGEYGLPLTRRTPDGSSGRALPGGLRRRPAPSPTTAGASSPPRATRSSGLPSPTPSTTPSATRAGCSAATGTCATPTTPPGGWSGSPSPAPHATRRPSAAGRSGPTPPPTTRRGPGATASSPRCGGTTG